MLKSAERGMVRIAALAAFGAIGLGANVARAEFAPVPVVRVNVGVRVVQQQQPFRPMPIGGQHSSGFGYMNGPGYGYAQGPGYGYGYRNVAGFVGGLYGRPWGGGGSSQWSL